MAASALERPAPDAPGDGPLGTESARAVATDLAHGHRRAVDVVAEALAAIAVHEPQVGALLHVAGRLASASAARIDRDWDRGRGNGPGLLAGVPVVVKDNIAVRGMPLTCGSLAWEQAPPRRDATLVRRLRRAGAVVVGKSNLDEFGMGATTETSAFGATRNPRDLTRTPGGSSGGSAAAVAAGEVPAAVGTDTGGSIREPAAQCGVVGVKPSHGSIPLGGIVPFAPSLDQAGPIARTVVDAAMLHQAMAGARNGRGLVESALAGAVDPDLTGHRVGVVSQMAGAANTAGVRARFADAIEVLTRLGADVVEVSLPATLAALEAYYVISSYESLATLEPYADGVLLGAEARRMGGGGRLARSRGRDLGPVHAAGLADAAGDGAAAGPRPRRPARGSAHRLLDGAGQPHRHRRAVAAGRRLPGLRAAGRSSADGAVRLRRPALPGRRRG